MSFDGTGNPSSMRKLNRKIIYDAIFANRELSRVQLARMTALKPPTVSNIIRQLEKENLIVNSGKGRINPKGGPLPELYRINCTGRYFVGLDISFEAISAVILDSDLKTAGVKHTPMEGEFLEDSAAMMSAVDSLIDELYLGTAFRKSVSAAGKAGKGSLAGIGISASGLVDHDNSYITLSKIKSLDKIDFRKALSDKYNAALYVDNDINILLSDIQASSPLLKASESALCFGIRSRGVGMSIAAGGMLYRGRHNISGNITLFDNRKSIEDIAVNTAGYRPGIDTEDPSVFLARLLAEGTGGDTGKNNSKRGAFYRKLYAGIRNSLHSMNECIAMLQRVFDTEHIIIACGFFKEMPDLFDFMAEECADMCGSPYAGTKYTMAAPEDAMYAESAARCVYRSIYENAAG